MQLFVVDGAIVVRACHAKDALKLTNGTTCVPLRNDGEPGIIAGRPVPRAVTETVIAPLGLSEKFENTDEPKEPKTRGKKHS